MDQPSRSIPRSGGFRNVKPYDNPEQSQELKEFNDIVWDLAKRWFMLKLWMEGCFYLKVGENDKQWIGVPQKCMRLLLVNTVSQIQME